MPCCGVSLPLLLPSGVDKMVAESTDSAIYLKKVYVGRVRSIFLWSSLKDFFLRKPLSFYVFFTLLFNAGLVPNTGRDSYTDQGEHHFQFQFLVSRAVLSDALLGKRARQQVQPPIVFDRYEGLNRPPWGATPPQHLQKPLETNTTQLSQ